MCFGIITGMKMPKIELKKGTGTPMSMQLAAAVKKLIIHGRLHPGDVLPGIYELAAQCGSSVKVARRALELLAKDGWTVPPRRRFASPPGCPLSPMRRFRF